MEKRSKTRKVAESKVTAAAKDESKGKSIEKVGLEGNKSGIRQREEEKSEESKENKEKSKEKNEKSQEKNKEKLKKMIQGSNEKQKMIKVSEKISNIPQKKAETGKDQVTKPEAPQNLEKSEKRKELIPEKNLNSKPIGNSPVSQNAAYHRKKTDLTLYANATFSGGVFLNSVPGQSV